MASATGSHPDTGSSVRPLPGSSTTIRPAGGRRFSAPKWALLTERGFVTGAHDGSSNRAIMRSLAQVVWMGVIPKPHGNRDQQWLGFD